MKKEYIVLAVIIVLLSAYLLLHNRDGNNYALPMVPEVKVSDITEIILERSGESIPIVKKDETWKVTDKQYPADAQSVTKMLDIVKDLKLSALISEAGENLSRYELDEAGRIGVTVKSNAETVRQLEIGKAAPSYRHTFVRLVGNPSVYHAAKNFRRDFEKSVNDLRDKSVLDFDKEKITEISLEKGGIGQTLALTNNATDNEGDGDKQPKGTASNERIAPDDGDAQEVSTQADPAQTDSPSAGSNTGNAPENGTKKVWRFKGDDTASELSTDMEKALKEILSTLSTLKCASYGESDDKEAAFKDRTTLATVTLKGDKAYSITLFSSAGESEDYPALSSGNAYPFFIGNYQGENILKKIDTILGIDEDKKIEDEADLSMDETDLSMDETDLSMDKTDLSMDKTDLSMDEEEKINLPVIPSESPESIGIEKSDTDLTSNEDEMADEKIDLPKIPSESPEPIDIEKGDADMASTDDITSTSNENEMAEQVNEETAEAIEE